jgi:hypothetical protein
VGGIQQRVANAGLDTSAPPTAQPEFARFAREFAFQSGLSVAVLVT